MKGPKKVICALCFLLLTAAYSLTAYADNWYIHFIPGQGLPEVVEKHSDYDTVDRPEDPKVDGLRFVCWSTDQENVKPFDFTRTYNLMGHKYLYGIWSDEYDVEFVPGQDFTNFTRSLKLGTPVSSLGPALLSPSKEGYAFKYWTRGTKYFGYYNASGEGKYDLNSSPNDSLILMGVWAKAYTVTFDTEGGSAIDKKAVEENTKVGKPSDPTKQGYRFDGWFSDSARTTKYDFNTLVTKNITLYAKWSVPATPISSTDSISSETPILLETVEKAIIGTKNENDQKGSTFSLLRAKGVPKSKSSIKLSWIKINGAAKYVIYGNKCGKSNNYMKITEVSGTSFTQKKLKKGTYYKYLVVAVRGDKALAVSKTIHVATKGGKVGNNTGVKLSKTKLSLKKGKSKTVKATLKAGRFKVKIHRKVAWESSNINVAKVNKKGKITGVKEGTCYVYAYAQNGISAKVKVTIK